MTAWRAATGSRPYTSYHPTDRGLMAKLKTLWEGLNNGPSGTYIRPHDGGYEFGRWWKQWYGGYRFEHLGERSTVQECRDAFESFDKVADKRARELNRKRRGKR